MKLTYAPDPHAPELFTTFSDADHGGDEDNRWSTSGMVVKMGTGAISWASQLQTIVTLSTTEAEYISAVQSGQEIIWLCNLLTEFGYEFTGPSTLYMDNQSALAVARNPEHHGRMKHLDLQHYWLRDVVEAGHIDIKYLPTKSMLLQFPYLIPSHPPRLSIYLITSLRLSIHPISSLRLLQQ
ncbi:hypothetical protein EW145_g7863 [Phellinidium pouzarii]|uniref:Reverse transcriptase Ty1/copia-type domain-containing protein n=1 Tax=Phellinidium pouzarii TaxID=167371 RepID=A0A4S4KDB3_9AGAM|nr:hypothetical protein EW145_g7863 [Phellinidium pouzarii]